MIILERVTALAQVGNQSYAIKSTRQGNHNPALNITQNRDTYRWVFTGLQAGIIQEVDADNPRQNHVDAYIGMDDLAAYIDEFPNTDVEPAGAHDGLRIPTGKERAGGTRIRWRGAVVRSLISSIDLVIPPIKLIQNQNDDVIFNLDRETSRYPIDNGNGRTTLEIHFGINHDFILKKDKRLNVSRIVFEMEAAQYSTILNALINEVDFYTTHLR